MKGEMLSDSPAPVEFWEELSMYRMSVEYSQGGLNFHLINDGDAWLLVDAGEPRCLPPQGLLECAGVSPSQIDCYLTHFHPDHVAFAQDYADAGARIFSCKSSLPEDFEMPPPEKVLRLYGMSADPACVDGAAAVTKLQYGRYAQVETTEYEDGDYVHVGSRFFRIVSMDGHCDRHGGLYEESTRIFFSGDEIIKGIVSIVYANALDCHDMTRYLATLNRLRDMGIEKMFPAHGEPIIGAENVIGVIDGLLSANKESVDRVHAILVEHGSDLSVHEVAESFFSYKEGGLAAYPPNMHVVCTSKTLGFLERLYDEGRAERFSGDDGEARYRAL